MKTPYFYVILVIKVIIPIALGSLESPTLISGFVISAFLSNVKMSKKPKSLKSHLPGKSTFLLNVRAEYREMWLGGREGSEDLVNNSK